MANTLLGKQPEDKKLEAFYNYFPVHTFGELCLSPVGLSSVTKLATTPFMGQFMGAWFLAISMGNLIAELLAGEFKIERVK